MAQTCTLKLEQEDVRQILDALSERLRLWQDTAAYLRDEVIASDAPVLADCAEASEADSVIQHYQGIIATIESQRS